jgi:hypothetical protein
LIARRQKILEEMPHLVEDLDELTALEKEIATLVARQTTYVSKARQVTAKIRSLAKKADNLRGRLGAGIRLKHGFDGMALIQFGFKPRRTKRHLEEEPEEVTPIPGEEEAPPPEGEDRES